MLGADPAGVDAEPEIAGVTAGAAAAVAGLADPVAGALEACVAATAAALFELAAMGGVASAPALPLGAAGHGLP